MKSFNRLNDSCHIVRNMPLYIHRVVHCHLHSGEKASSTTDANSVPRCATALICVNAHAPCKLSGQKFWQLTLTEKNQSDLRSQVFGSLLKNGPCSSFQYFSAFTPHCLPCSSEKGGGSYSQWLHLHYKYPPLLYKFNCNVKNPGNCVFFEIRLDFFVREPFLTALQP